MILAYGSVFLQTGAAPVSGSEEALRIGEVLRRLLQPVSTLQFTEQRHKVA